MLTIVIGEEEFYDEVTNTFSVGGGVKVDLEHSLLSVSKWESKFQKPFLAKGEKTTEEILEYLRFMVLTENFDIDLFKRLSAKNFDEINLYIESKESATTFPSAPTPSGRTETVTSELIYYWMVTFNIPFSCETWNLNRLFSLLRICSIKNSKPKKMSKREIAERNRALNAERKAQLGTRG